MVIGPAHSALGILHPTAISLNAFQPCAKLVMDKQSVVGMISHPDLSPSLLNSVDEKRRDMLPIVLDEAFYASLQRNEGRPVRFAILLENDTFKSGPIREFSAPRSFNTKQLQSISVAYDPSSVCLVVDRPSPVSSSIEIIGVAARPVPALRLSTQYPPAVIVEAVNPGTISLEIGELKAVYSNGETVLSNLQVVERLHVQSSLPSRAITPTRLGPHLRLGTHEVTGLDEEMWANHKKEYEQLVNSYWPRLFSGAMVSIIKKTISKAHGGGYLFLKRISKPNSLTGGSWFRTPSQQLTHWLSRTLAIKGLLSLALRGKTVTSDLDTRWRDNVQEWGRTLLHPTFRDSLLNLDYACAECAHLSEADGVTVLNHDFEVLGFGASIGALDQKMPDDWIEHLSTRGNRHRSMANAVALMEGSIGIVISQDGGVTIFSNHDGHDMRLIILTL